MELGEGDRVYRKMLAACKWSSRAPKPGNVFLILSIYICIHLYLFMGFPEDFESGLV